MTSDTNTDIPSRDDPMADVLAQMLGEPVTVADPTGPVTTTSVGESRAASTPATAADFVASEPAPSAEVKPPVHAVQPEVQKTEAEHRVPLSELRSERDKRQQLQREVEELRARLNAQPQQPAQPAPDFFVDPAAATRHAVAPEIDQVRQTMLFNSRLIAEARFGADTVEKAQMAFDGLLADGKVDPLEYHRVMNSPNPFAAAVNWHARHSVLSEVGSDPVAYRNKVSLDARNAALDDPEFLRQAAERYAAKARENPSFTTSPAQTARAAQVSPLPSLSRTGTSAAPPQASLNTDFVSEAIGTFGRRLK
jgi:hypothetical protein